MSEVTFADIQKANQGIKTTDVKGKQYAEVNQRVMAFRSIYPNGSIQTEILNCSDGIVTMQTIVKDEQGKVLATGLAYEKENSTFINKSSYIENCETSSVGRALGFCGLGIDGSIASAEEVGNAIKQQESSQKGAKITFDEVEVLVSLAKRKGLKTPVRTLSKKYGVNALSELSKQQYDECIKGLEGMNDV